MHRLLEHHCPSSAKHPLHCTKQCFLKCQFNHLTSLFNIVAFHCSQAKSPNSLTWITALCPDSLRTFYYSNFIFPSLLFTIYVPDSLDSFPKAPCSHTRCSFCIGHTSFPSFPPFPTVCHFHQIVTSLFTIGLWQLINKYLLNGSHWKTKIKLITHENKLGRKELV